MEAVLLTFVPVTGVTLCAKNHFGSFWAEGKDIVLSPKFEKPEWRFKQRDMGTYNPMVDLMGHKHLGGKTLLFMVDGLYAVQTPSQEVNGDQKWRSVPFNNNWTASLFISQDGVAIDSVCLDFMRSEPTMWTVSGNVDNWLHEAALANNPPSGTVYDPEGDGTSLTSLGVHEHWNNPRDK